MAEAVKEAPAPPQPDPTDRSHALAYLHSIGISDRQVIDAFQILAYESGSRYMTTLLSTRWLGYNTIKWPHDLFLMQELMWEYRPSLLIETGTANGGSSLFFASVMDMYGHGKVVSIDLTPWSTNLPTHPRVQFIGGRSSVDPLVLDEVKRWIDQAEGGPVFVYLDSAHNADHVGAELDAYHHFVTPGGWLIVEDTNLDKRPVVQSSNALGTTDLEGPGIAVDRWLPEHPDFRIEERKATRYLFSACSWLRRLRP